MEGRERRNIAQTEMRGKLSTEEEIPRGVFSCFAAHARNGTAKVEAALLGA